MTELTPYDAYRIFNGIKLHFTASYDFIKYRGKIKVNEATFETKKEKYLFARISKKYNLENYTDFVLANILENPKIWVNSLFEETAHENFLKFQTNKESFPYIFSEEVKGLLDWCEEKEISFQELFKVRDNDTFLLRHYRHKNISLETLIVLDMIIGFLEPWSRKIEDTLLFPKLLEKIRKYTPFLSIDLDLHQKKLEKLLNG